jgi:hypothetical protein
MTVSSPPKSVTTHVDLIIEKQESAIPVAIVPSPPDPPTNHVNLILENREELITLQDAAKLIPGRDQGHVHEFTVQRWTRPPGKRGVILESVLAGPCRCTSREALIRFMDRVTHVASKKNLRPALGKIATRTRREKLEAVRKALVELEEMGA